MNICPLVDPDNIDIIRATAGLSSMSEYLDHLGVKWEVEKYKNDLPQIEKDLKSHKN